MDSPIGPLGLAAEDGVLVAVTFDGLGSAPDLGAPAAAARWRRRRHGSGWSRAALRRFFDGELDALAELPVRFHGTRFQIRVWRSLRRIPAGTTVVLPRSWRSGSAMSVPPGRSARRTARTRFRWSCPCHRVIGSDGGLTGFGGGLPRKRWLLEHEGATPSTGRRCSDNSPTPCPGLVHASPAHADPPCPGAPGRDSTPEPHHPRRTDRLPESGRAEEVDAFARSFPLRFPGKVRADAFRNHPGGAPALGLRRQCRRRH